MNRVFVGIGSNEGDRLEHILAAARALSKLAGSMVVRMAVIIETEPLGGPPQSPYLNTALEMETSLEPNELLDELQNIERLLGRVPSPERWGPRTIDLDILLYGDHVICEPRLSIPHPRMHERRFVLEPLAQLYPDLRHPVLKETISELLAKKLKDSQLIQAQ